MSTGNNGYQGDLEFAIIPDSFRKDVLAEKEDETDKVLMEYSNAEAKPFALLYQFTGPPGSVRRAPPSTTVRPPPRTS